MQKESRFIRAKGWKEEEEEEGEVLLHSSTVI
jgi:hypothetical protein